jgi:hypothetical protein
MISSIRLCRLGVSYIKANVKSISGLYQKSLDWIEFSNFMLKHTLYLAFWEHQSVKGHLKVQNLQTRWSHGFRVFETFVNDQPLDNCIFIEEQYIAKKGDWSLSAEKKIKKEETHTGVYNYLLICTFMFHTVSACVLCLAWSSYNFNFPGRYQI